MISVSTSLVHPALCYALTTDGTTYHFAHPAHWSPTKPDIGMDACNRWGVGIDDAKAAFWEFVAGSVVWPAASVLAGEIIEGARLAEIERQKVLAGHISLFDD